MSFSLSSLNRYFPSWEGGSALKPKKETTWDFVMKIFAGYLYLSAVKANPINIISPLPDLTATPGVPLWFEIDMLAHFQLANPQSNLELSIQSAPSWLSINMGAPTIDKSIYYVGDYTIDILQEGSYAYLAMNTGLKIIDISNTSFPAINFKTGTEYTLAKVGNYLFYRDYTNVYTLDISDSSSITLKETYSNGNYTHDIKGAGQYLFILQEGYPRSTVNLVVMKPLTPVTAPPFFISSSSGGAWDTIEIFDNYAYVSHQQYFSIIDITNPLKPALLSSVYSTLGPTYGKYVKGQYLFVSNDVNLGIYSITNRSNPLLMKTFYIGGPAFHFILENHFLYAFCGWPASVKIVDVSNVLAPKLVASTPTRSWPFNAFLRNNQAYIADSQAGLSIMNLGKRVLTGVPSLTDRGLWHVNIIATDELGNSVTDPIALHVGDVNISPLPDQQVYVGSSKLFAFASGTFDYPGAAFTYSATLAGGLPLPPFISFDPPSRAFIFAPRSGDQNSYTIQVAADDGYQSVTTTFTLSVPDRPPVLEQPLSNQIAYTGEPFEYLFSNTTFSDLDQDTLSISARLTGTTGLPRWLNFDPQLRMFFGTPIGKANYPIEVIASDGFGGSATAAFNITVPPTPPVLINPPGTQLASAGIPFSYIFSSNTFFDADNDPLTYSIGPLPPFLTFNSAARTLSGTPQKEDANSTYSITLYAQDSAGRSAEAQLDLSVLAATHYNNPPVIAIEIPDTTKKAGVPFNYTFSSGTFIDPEGGPLTYQATLEGGDPLPAELAFDSDTRTLSGVVQEPQVYRISIRAIDQLGAFVIDTFVLTIIDSNTYPPIVLNPLPDVVATVDNLFVYNIPQDTFSSAQAEISVSPLPKWLKWIPESNSLEGKPGPWDTGTYQDKVIALEVWGNDEAGSAMTTFHIIVQGESFWESFIKTGFTIASVIASGIGVWESRALIWNYLRKDKYRRGIERTMIGEEFTRPLRLNFKEIKEIKVYSKGHPLAKLPDGLVYANNQISGIPKCTGLFTIRVYDQKGYINEEFDLSITHEEEEMIEEEGIVMKQLLEVK